MYVMNLKKKKTWPHYKVHTKYACARHDRLHACKYSTKYVELARDRQCYEGRLTRLEPRPQREVCTKSRKFRVTVHRAAAEKTPLEKTLLTDILKTAKNSRAPA